MFKITSEEVDLVRQMIEQNKLPQFLYKYYSINEFTEKVIIENSIWFGSAKEFNDPFDCQLVPNNNHTQTDINNYVNSLEKNPESRKVIFDQIKRDPNSLNNTIIENLKKFSNQAGITCFTTKNTNILMWAHYTDKHKGICLKFDLLKSLETFTIPIVMDYPNFNYINDHSEGLIKFMFKTKSEEWKYENEYRILKPEIRTYEFNKEALVEITFGVNCLSENITKYKNLLKEYDYKTSLKFAAISNNKFELIIKNCR